MEPILVQSGYDQRQRLERWDERRCFIQSRTKDPDHAKERTLDQLANQPKQQRYQTCRKYSNSTEELADIKLKYLLPISMAYS